MTPPLKHECFQILRKDALKETALIRLEYKPLAGGDTASCLPVKALKKNAKQPASRKQNYINP